MVAGVGPTCFPRLLPLSSRRTRLGEELGLGEEVDEASSDDLPPREDGGVDGGAFPRHGQGRPEAELPCLHSAYYLLQDIPAPITYNSYISFIPGLNRIKPDFRSYCRCLNFLKWYHSFARAYDLRRFMLALSDTARAQQCAGCLVAVTF